MEMKCNVLIYRCMYRHAYAIFDLVTNHASRINNIQLLVQGKEREYRVPSHIDYEKARLLWIVMLTWLEGARSEFKRRAKRGLSLASGAALQALVQSLALIRANFDAIGLEMPDVASAENEAHWRAAIKVKSLLTKTITCASSYFCNSI